ncbi:MAG TPA: hypothetical protein VKC62_07255 [Gaiellaceae bacterium]|nr:hypothetical protein [Gaiellaceae bacterium]
MTAFIVVVLVAVSPCKLVTAPDAAAVLGGPVGKPKAQALGLYKSCTYTRGGATVTVQTRPLAKADFVKSAKANPKPVVAVPGLGAPAYFAGGFVLLAWRHGTEATFTVFGAAGKPLVAEKALAKRALARL